MHGPAIDEPLAQEDGAGNLSFLHADGLGSVVKNTNSAGDASGSRRYDSFGNHELGATNGYAFTGREWDGDIGLYFYRARYYDPLLGRFISEDPIDPGDSEGENLYVYVENEPVSSIDPSGRTRVVVTGCGKNTKRVQKAARKAEKGIKRCISCEEKDRLRAFETITIMCTTRTTSPFTGKEICAEKNYKFPIIYLTPHGLHNKSQCRCLQALLMHEALHAAGRTNEQHDYYGIGFKDVKRCFKCGF